MQAQLNVKQFGQVKKTGVKVILTVSKKEKLNVKIESNG